MSFISIALCHKVFTEEFVVFSCLYKSTAHTITAIQKHQKVALEKKPSANPQIKFKNDGNSVNIRTHNILIKGLFPKPEGGTALMQNSCVVFPSHICKLLLWWLSHYATICLNCSWKENIQTKLSTLQHNSFLPRSITSKKPHIHQTIDTNTGSHKEQDYPAGVTLTPLWGDQGLHWPCEGVPRFPWLPIPWHVAGEQPL